MEKSEMEELFGDVMFSYTRADALADGELVDVTEFAKTDGFKIPVALTSALYNRYVVPESGDKEFGQSVKGRLHDVLSMLLFAIKTNPSTDTLFYSVYFSFGREKKLIGLKAVLGGGDDGKPVLTIMLKTED
jgi:hypothetical protein